MQNKEQAGVWIACRRRLSIALAALVSCLAAGASAQPLEATTIEHDPSAGKHWPIPVPSWFWPWARRYLGRSEFAENGPANPAARPPSAPRVIPEWAWRRLAVLLGQELPPLPTETLRRGAREYVRILRARPPAQPLTNEDNYVYVDVERQIMLDVRRGRVTRVVPVSSGGGYTYVGLDGARHVAVTPRGTFHIFRKVAGKDKSYLGTLNYPSYFTNGYAVHGSTSVPPRPVSHGCVRIPNYLARIFFRRMQIGTTVAVA
jgi:lipoprotein-anchoring transpeptidase ErfK/SrfK